MKFSLIIATTALISAVDGARIGLLRVGTGAKAGETKYAGFVKRSLFDEDIQA